MGIDYQSFGLYHFRVSVKSLLNNDLRNNYYQRLTMKGLLILVDTTMGQLCSPNHVAGNSVILSVCLIPYNTWWEVVWPRTHAYCELWLFLSEAKTREGVAGMEYNEWVWLVLLVSNPDACSHMSCVSATRLKEGISSIWPARGVPRERSVHGWVSVG